jgi:DNA repair protein RadC
MQPDLASDEELLAVFLGGAQDAIHSSRILEMARALLKRFRDWNSLLAARPEEWAAVPGIGPSKLEKLAVLQEMGKRLSAKSGQVHLQRSSRAAKYFAFLEKEDQETISAAFLHSNNELISVQEIFRGTSVEVRAQPREILRAALKANAAKIILAHNHLSSDLLPSEEDVRFTARLEWAAKMVGLFLADHLIIGQGGRYFSFAESKLLGKSDRPSNKRYFQ